MAELGGYFAVSYVAEHVLTDAVDAAFRVRWRDAAGSARWGADTPFGRLEAGGAVSLDKPGVALSGAANAVRLGLSGVGRFDLTLGGAPAGGIFVEARAEVSVPIRVSQEAQNRKAVVDLTGVVLQVADLRLTWFDGPPDGRSEAALLGPDARKALTDELLRRAASYLTFRLPTDQLWLAETMLMTQGIPGSIIFTPQIKLGAARVLNGWLALGIDATSGIGESHGDPAGIGPPPDAPPRVGHAQMPEVEEGDASLRLLMDPALVLTYLAANAKFAMQMAAALRPNIHPDLNVEISLEDDTVVAHAHGMVDAPDPFPGQVPFTADLRVQPFIPKNANTVYASVHPDIRVHAPWFLDVLGAMAEFIGIDVFGKLRRANKSALAILFGVKAVVKVPDFGSLEGRIEGRRIVLRPDLVGIYGEARISSFGSGPPGDLTPKVWPGFYIRDRFLRLRLDQFGRLVTDPTWRIRYRIRRGSDGAEVDAGTVWAGLDPFGGPVDLWDASNYLETAFDVDLVAERPPGREVARQTQSVAVVDLFDRAHPFVRWRKTHFFTGGQSSTRLSAIHRTAIRERCQFCDTGTQRDRATYVIEALDSVPAPREDGFSDRLCRYCFPEG